MDDVVFKTKRKRILFVICFAIFLILFALSIKYNWSIAAQIPFGILTVAFGSVFVPILRE